MPRPQNAKKTGTEPPRSSALEVEQRPIDSIRPYDDNPRRNDHAVEAVAASIREFGFRQPIVVDEQGVIVVGETRWKAALKLDLATVPVRVMRGATPEQLRAYRIADNKTGEIATWDNEALRSEREALAAGGLGLSVLSFDGDELRSPFFDDS